MVYAVAREEKFIDLAYKLIKDKSNKDDIKASEDLSVLDAMLSEMETCFNPWQVDIRLRQDYKTIEMLENIQSNFCYNNKRILEGNITEYERVINNLKIDRAGIIADILIKHKRIKFVDELYKSI